MLDAQPVKHRLQSSAFHGGTIVGMQHGWGVIPILVACALDFDLRTLFNMGIMPLGKRASAAQIGISTTVAVCIWN